MPTTTERKFKVELVPANTKATHLNISPTIVDIKLSVTTKRRMPGNPDPMSDAAMKRLEKAARDALKERAKYITAFVTIFDREIDKMIRKAGMSQKLLKDAEAGITRIDQRIKKACDAAEAAATDAAEKRLLQEKNDLKNLSEARLATAFKWTTSAMSISVALIRLVVSAGADVSGYVSIAMALNTLQGDFRQQLKGEEVLHKDINAAVQALVNYRKSAILKVAKDIGLTDTNGLSMGAPKEAAIEIGTRAKALGSASTADDVKKLLVTAVKSQMNDCVAAHKAYRNHLTKFRKNVDKMSSNAGKLEKQLAKKNDIKGRPALLAQCKQLEDQVDTLAKELEKNEKFLVDMKAMITSNGVDLDDRTMMDKLTGFNKTTVATQGATVVSTTKGLVDAVVLVSKTVL